jgi:hypothetical protein
MKLLGGLLSELHRFLFSASFKQSVEAYTRQQFQPLASLLGYKDRALH